MKVRKLIRNVLTAPMLPLLPSVVTIGNFDSLHLGHQQLLDQLVAEPLRSVLVTFDPQPSEVFSEHPPARLLRFREKWEKLRQWPLDFVCMLPFSMAIAQMTPEAFVSAILVNRLSAKKVIVGDDFRFGQRRAGNVNVLTALGQRYGFEVCVIQKQSYQGKEISSSWIRELVREGDFSKVETLLGEPYSHSGRVVYGNQLGRVLGCPTANIPMHRKTSPLQGVYVVEVEGLAEKPLRGVASVGTRPAVGGKTFLLEVHLFDFHENIYGKLLKVRYLKKLRDEWMFDSLEALKQQIAKDCEQARAYWKNVSTQ